MEKQIDEQMSLQIIREAIENARSNIKDNGFFYLLWGWLVLIASLLQFSLLKFTDTPYHWVGWPIMMTGGAIVSVVYGYRLGRRSAVMTHVDIAMIYLWYGFLIAISIMIAMAIFGVMTFSMLNPLIIVFYGLGTFVAGGILRYKPLIFGGVGAWIISLFAFIVQSEFQLLFMALAIIIAYLVPGYMLKSRSEDHV
jgi:hypothetical protein